MPAPPVTNPTPYTCPNCGLAMEQRAEFCPRCGAQLHAKARRSAGWIVGSILLGLGALLFGGIGACSAAFTYGSLAAPTNEFGQAFLVISIPLLLVGLAGVFACGRALYRRSRK